MSESTIRKICFFSSIIGIVVLYIFTLFLEPYQLSIASIMDTDIGKMISVKGTVKSVYFSEKTLFFELHDNGRKIDVVSFDNKLNTTENSSITVIGRLSMYKGNAEIIVEKIK